MDGFLFIDKPVGLTSHDVVAKIRRQFKLDKVGHTGTLDPFASGLLILCLGKATKLAYLFSDLDKAYEGTLVFGSHYDTYDTTGKVMKKDHPTLSEHQIKNTMQSFLGSYEQLPPMYSALKVNGQKLYDIARRGDEIDREKRLVDIHQFELLSYDGQLQMDFYAHVSKGTYIRSLAVDLSERLGTLGALSRLRRLQVGSYHIAQAKTMEHVTLDDVVTLETYFRNTPSIVLNDYMIKLVKNGVYLDERQIETDQPFIVKNQDGNMIAYYTVNDMYHYRPVIIF
ncbi:MAG TPA: tRNA pseudouridine(55) synthase TruB [Acholeplasmataceae bacterium]|mgnify:FL=1|nr:tRNA pseudouridine(55) synthase TruB [Acholeplasmataceae bacterium]HRX45198.1 tRNA pseudouridine(55) synthase TruB [Acholeplasmataceae bacterium]